MLSAEYAHLNDGKYSAEEFATLAASLLTFFPTDSTVIHGVLAAARKRTGGNTGGRIIESIGLAKVTDPDALAYVRDGFKNRALHIAMVEAVGRMPKQIRATFVNELRSVAQDANEHPETRAAAEQALTEP